MGNDHENRSRQHPPDGEYNNCETNDSDYLFTNNGDGTYTLTLLRDEDSVLEYRITRGTLVSGDKFDPDDRFANRILEIPADVAEHIIDITIKGDGMTRV